MLGSVNSPVMYVISHSVEGVIRRNITVYTVGSSHKKRCYLHAHNARHKRGNEPYSHRDIKKKSTYTEISTNYLKHTHTVEDYSNRSHKEIKAVFTKYNRAIYFNLNFNRNFNFKIETSNAVKSLAQ
jgi:hypothetical protein